MKRFFFFLACLLVLTGCASASGTQETDGTRPFAENHCAATAPETLPPETLPPETLPPETEPPSPAEELLRSMPLEDWVGQLFLVGADPNLAEAHIREYNLGGFLLFSHDFENGTPGDSAGKKIARWQDAASIPLLIATDEEGGTVNRVSRYRYYRSSPFRSPRQLYDLGGLDSVLAEEQEKCALLRSLGVNVNLGPVCDITTDPAAFLYSRSLGQDPGTTADCVAQTVRLKRDASMGSALKHFPGYGNNADTHTGIAIDSRPLEELESRDLLPFQAGIDAGAGAVMVSHTIVQALDPDLPASLSPAVHRYLRETMGFEGVIITDDLTMQAITDRYGAGEAAVQAVLAGNDLLCSSTFIEQYDAVLAAVLDGRIPFDTVKNAALNVLEWKLELGLI